MGWALGPVALVSAVAVAVVLVLLAFVRRRGRSLPEWIVTARQLRSRQKSAAKQTVPPGTEPGLVPAVECDPTLRTYTYGSRERRPVGIIGDGTFVTAVVQRALAEAEQTVDRIDLTGDPRDALHRLIAGSWSLTADAGALLAAAEQALPAEDVRAAHDGLLARATALIERGRAEGAFRTDLSSSWLASVLHSLVHCAATEVAAGRLSAEDAADYIAATALSSFTPPG